MHLLWAIIAVRHEGHRYDFGGESPASHRHDDGSARRRELPVDIPHRDRPADARAKSTGRHLPDRGALDQDLRSLTRRNAAVHLQADAPPVRSALQLVQNAGCARESALLTPALPDRPGKSRLDRRGARVDIVPIKAQTRFQAQRVAGAEPDQLHFRMREQALDDGADPNRLDRNLEAILAGIARPADVTFDAVKS